MRISISLRLESRAFSCTSRIALLSKVVRKLENAIHQIITVQRIAWFVLITLIHWLAIYLVGSVIQPLNNRAWFVHCTVDDLRFVWFVFRFHSKIRLNCINKEMITRNIEAVSNISDINVDTPFNWLSPDPTRAKMQSVMEISAELHGTKHPSWAISTITPVWRWNTERQTSMKRKNDN